MRHGHGTDLPPDERILELDLHSNWHGDDVININELTDSLGFPQFQKCDVCSSDFLGIEETL